MDKVLFNFHDVVLIMTTTLCLAFVILILCLKKDKDTSDYFFVFFIFLQSFIPLDILFNFGAAFKDWAAENSPSMFYTFGIAYWLEAPAMLLYIRYKLIKNRQHRYSDILYLLPAVSYFLFMSITYYSLSSPEQTTVIKDTKLLNNSINIDLIILSRELFRVLVGALCIKSIIYYKKHAMNIESAAENINLSWLITIGYSFLSLRIFALILAIVIIISSHTSFNFYLDFYGLTANYITLGLVFTLICAYLINNQKLTGLQEAKNKPIKPPKEEIKLRLDTFISEQKPYLKNNLSLDQLSERCGISARNISSIINHNYNKNFFEYINDFRLCEAKEMLKKQPKKSITEIFYDCGFNSKATFNTYFKKQTGMTPTEYRKSVIN